jgi:hypothetical protein
MKGQFNSPAALTPRKSPRYPLDMKMYGLQFWSGRYGEVKIWTLSGLKFWLLCRPVRSQSDRATAAIGK